MLFTHLLINTILITATRALKISSLVVTEPLSQTTNVTLTWTTNSSDPDTANLEVRHPRGSNAPVGQAIDLSKKFFFVVSPFTSINKGGHGRFAFLDVRDGDPLALTPPFQVDDDGSVREINGSMPIITGTSAIPSNTGTSDPSSSSNGLSTAAAIGVGVGVALAVAISSTLGFLLIRRRRRAHFAQREAALKLELDGTSSSGQSSSYTRGPTAEEAKARLHSEQYQRFKFGLDANQPKAESPPVELAEEQRAELAPGETGVPHITIRPELEEETDFLSPTTTEAAYEISSHDRRPLGSGQM